MMSEKISIRVPEPNDDGTDSETYNCCRHEIHRDQNLFQKFHTVQTPYI